MSLLDLLSDPAQRAKLTLLPLSEVPGNVVSASQARRLAHPTIPEVPVADQQWWRDPDVPLALLEGTAYLLTTDGRPAAFNAAAVFLDRTTIVGLGVFYPARVAGDGAGILALNVRMEIG